MIDKKKTRKERMLMQNDGGDGCVAACTPRVLSVYEHGGKKKVKRKRSGGTRGASTRRGTKKNGRVHGAGIW